MIEAASELLQGHRYTPEWWSRTRDIRRHSCVRTPQFRSRAVEWTRRASYLGAKGRKCFREKHHAAPLTQPVGDPTGWSTKMTARPITTAGSRPRRSTRQAVGRVPRLLLGKGKQITRLPRSHKARAASANANAITAVAVRTSGRIRGDTPFSVGAHMQPPAQVQNAELPAERQRLELRRRAMDAARSVGLAPPQPAITPRSTRVQVQGPRGTCEITGGSVRDVEPAARVRSRDRKRGRVREGSGGDSEAQGIAIAAPSSSASATGV